MPIACSIKFIAGTVSFAHTLAELFIVKRTVKNIKIVLIINTSFSFSKLSAKLVLEQCRKAQTLFLLGFGIQIRLVTMQGRYWSL